MTDFLTVTFGSGEEIFQVYVDDVAIGHLVEYADCWGLHIHGLGMRKFDKALVLQQAKWKVERYINQNSGKVRWLLPQLKQRSEQ